MGNNVSIVEYKELLNQLSTKDLGNRDKDSVLKFCEWSSEYSVQPSDTLELRQNKPMNFLYIIREVIDIFHTNAVSTDTFEDATQINIMKGCINILTCFLPYIMDDKAYLDKVLWSKDGEAFGIKLCDTILDLLFKPGFTIRPMPSDDIVNTKAIDQNALWKNGISTSGDVYNHYYNNYDDNRISLLRLLLVCISQPLYHEAGEYLTILNPFSCYFTCRRSKNVKNLFVSLLNNIIAYDVDGYGIPYFSTVNTEGQQEKLLETGLHILLILIEYKPPTPENLKYLIEGGYISLKKIYDHFKSTDNAGSEEKSVDDDLTTNEFHRLLQVIHGKMNLEPFVESMTKFFNNLIEPHQSYLPSSVTQIPFYQELLILFWKFIQNNVYFLEETISHPEFLPKIYTAILYYFDSMKKDPSKCNLLYICVFVLLTFSGNRDFSMALNEQYNMSMQFDLKDFESGTYADLTYQVIHRMIKAGPATLKPLYKSLVSVISNTAPYAKSLSKDSSECIFSLIKKFSDPELLKKREETSRILSNLFEAVNYILLYHDEGNEEFLVALIKYREILKINDIKLTEGVPQAQPEAQPKPAVKDDNADKQEQPKKDDKEAPKVEDVAPVKVEDNVPVKIEDKAPVKVEDKAPVIVEDKPPVKEEQKVDQNQAQPDQANQEQSDKAAEEPKDDTENKETEAVSESTGEAPETSTSTQNAAEASTSVKESVETSKTQNENADEIHEGGEEVEEAKAEPANEDTKEADSDAPVKTEESKNSDEHIEDDGNMVDVPLDNIKHSTHLGESEDNKGQDQKPKTATPTYQFMTPEWEEQWKNGLNLPNIKQAIQYTDDKARSFLAKNPSPDNNIDADKFVEYLKKSSLKGLLPNQVKILVTTYNGNSSIDTWAISYIWGQIFMRQQDVPLFNIEKIKMFKVNFVQP